MLPKFKGASSYTSVAVKPPSLVEELMRSKEKGARRNASTPRANCFNVFISFQLIYH